MRARADSPDSAELFRAAGRGNGEAQRLRCSCIHCASRLALPGEGRSSRLRQRSSVRRCTPMRRASSTPRPRWVACGIASAISSEVERHPPIGASVCRRRPRGQCPRPSERRERKRTGLTLGLDRLSVPLVIAAPLKDSPTRPATALSAYFRDDLLRRRSSRHSAGPLPRGNSGTRGNPGRPCRPRVHTPVAGTRAELDARGSPKPRAR